MFLIDDEYSIFKPEDIFYTFNLIKIKILTHYGLIITFKSFFNTLTCLFGQKEKKLYLN